MQQKIIILDFGSQTTQLIGRRVRELDTFCEILPYNKFPKDDPILDTTPYIVKLCSCSTMFSIGFNLSFMLIATATNNLSTC